MKRHFIPMLVLCAFMMTMQSEDIHADHPDNEDAEVETRWWWNMKVWGVDQIAKDDDELHHMDTKVYNYTIQKSWRHHMYASTYFESRYEHPKTTGDFHLKAELKAPWATDEEPFEEKGKIKGKKGGMEPIEGSQSDMDYMARRDPRDTIKLIDSFSKAKIWHFFRKRWYRASSSSYFVPLPENIKNEEAKP